MVDASWDQEGIFKNRPHTTLTFERQVDHVFHCLGEWDHEKVSFSNIANIVAD